MMEHPLLPKLKRLKLSGMVASLEERARYAREQNLGVVEFLALLLDDEHERREQEKYRRGVKEAGLEEGKTLTRFDFAACPRASKALISDLATCAYVAKGDNLIFFGPTGTGKSHLAQGLAYEAIKKSHRVLFRTTHNLLGTLQGARADGTVRRLKAKIANIDVLVLDDFGLVPVTDQGAEDLYELIRERYERKSTILTSNRSPDEWGEVFHNPLLASAALDRLTHHSHLVELTGDSFRQKQRRKGEPKKE